MANTNPTAPDLTEGQLNQYRYLLRQKADIQRRINALMASVTHVNRPHWGPCTRCGHDWYGLKPQKPKNCPNCRSPYWDRPYSLGPRRKREPKFPGSWDGKKLYGQRRNKLQVVTAAPASLTPPPLPSFELNQPVRSFPDRFLDGPPQPERMIRHEGNSLTPPVAPAPEPVPESALAANPVDDQLEKEEPVNETEPESGVAEPTVELAPSGGESQTTETDGPKCCSRPTYIDGFCINCGTGLETVTHGHNHR